MTICRTRRASLLVSSLLTALGLAGCGEAGDPGGPSPSDGDPPPAPAGEVHLEASADLFAEAPFAAHAEASTPGVLASLDVEAWGSATVDARVLATASSDGAVALEEVRGGAEVTIEGGVSLDGRLVVDIPGVADYDGPIAGLEDHELRFEARRAIDVLSTESGAARADLATGNGTSVDLPGVDGRLVLAVGADSFVETHLVAECASADEDAVEVRGRLVTSGLLIVQPSLELDAPILGTQLMALAEVWVTIEGEAAVVMTAHVDALASGDGSLGASLPSCQ